MLSTCLTAEPCRLLVSSAQVLIYLHPSESHTHCRFPSKLGRSFVQLCSHFGIFLDFFLYVYVYLKVCCVYVGWSGSRKPEEDAGSSWAGVTGSSKLADVRPGMNLGPLEEPSFLLPLFVLMRKTANLPTSARPLSNT